MHNWKMGDLGKCKVLPTHPDLVSEIKPGDVNMVTKYFQRGGEAWYLMFVGKKYYYRADHFVPVTPTKEEPKVRIKEDA